MVLINEKYLNTLIENCSSTTMLFKNPPQTMVSDDQYGDASGGLGFESTQHHSRPEFTQWQAALPSRILQWIHAMAIWSGLWEQKI